MKSRISGRTFTYLFKQWLTVVISYQAAKSIKKSLFTFMQSFSWHETVVPVCFHRPWSWRLPPTWFRGWSTTGLSLCTHMEDMQITPCRATSTAPCLFSIPVISQRIACPRSLTTSPPAGIKIGPSVCDMLSFVGTMQTGEMLKVAIYGAVGSQTMFVFWRK